MARRGVDYQDIADQFREGNVRLDGVVVDGDNDILHELGENDLIHTEIRATGSVINNLNLNEHPPPNQDQHTIFESSFNNSTLNNCNFSNIVFHRVRFNGTNLNNCNFSGCIFDDVTFDRRTELNNCNFSGCSFNLVTFVRGVRLINCYWILSIGDTIPDGYNVGDVMNISTEFIFFAIVFFTLAKPLMLSATLFRI